MKLGLAKMSLKNKAYAVILAIGFTALLADRWTRRGPASAIAGATSPQSLLIPASERMTTPFSQATADRSIARMLRTAAKSANWSSARAGGSRDAFSPWSGTGDGTGVGEGTLQDQSAKKNPDAKFAQIHRLTEVLTSGNQRRVVVNGHILAIGQTLDGFTLVTINARSATFQSPRSRPVLSLDQNAAAAIQSR